VSETKRYFGGWDNYEQMAQEWGDYGGKEAGYCRVPPADMPPDSAILFALYDGGGYDGWAIVIFEQDGKLFEVNGSHCSCYGLEDQWNPEETSWGALKDRKLYYGYGDGGAKEVFEALVASRLEGSVAA
jgi:hypothetical protein